MPLDLLAISIADSSSIFTSNILADLFTIICKSSGSYSSNLCIIPNLSRNGVVNEPALVVAPIKVNLGKSILIDFALAPVPITMSKV